LSNDLLTNSDGSGSKIFDPGQIGSIFSSSIQVGSAIYGLGLDLENFHCKCQNFQFFSLLLKKSLRVGSKAVGLLFTAGQTLGRVTARDGP